MSALKTGLSSEHKQEKTLKVLVIGEFAVGKTSIIRRYTEGTFSSNYKLTIGVDFALKTLQWEENTKINLQLWDIAGHERFGHMTRVYYKYALATLVVCDLTRLSTLQAVTKWLDDLHNQTRLPDDVKLPVILLANKCDQDQVEVDDESIEKVCKDQNILGWYKTSAKQNIKIDDAITHLIKEVLHSGQTMERQDTICLEDRVDGNIPGKSHPTSQSNSTCC